MLNVRRVTTPFYSMLSLVAALWVAILLFVNIPLFLNYIQDNRNAGLYYYALFPLAFLLFLLEPSSLRPFLKHRLFHWSVVMLLLYALNYVRLGYFDYPADDLELETDRMERMMLLPVMAYIVFTADARWFRRLIPLGVVVAILLIVVDLLDPSLLTNPVEGVRSGRAEGTYRNANAAAEAVLLGCVLMQGLVRRFPLGLIMLIGGVAVLFTFSRSGILIYLITAAIFFVGGRFPKHYLIAPIALVIAFGSLSVMLEDYLRSIPDYQYKVDNMVNRMNFFSRDLKSVAADSEGDDRAALAVDALVEIMEKPVLGHGVPYAASGSDTGVHNMLLSLWYHYGLAGLLMWGWLIHILWKAEPSVHPLLRLAPLMFAYFSMFSHNIIDYVYWYAFISMYLFVTSRDALSWAREGDGGSRFVSAGDPLPGGRRRKGHRRRRRSSVAHPAR